MSREHSAQPRALAAEPPAGGLLGLVLTVILAGSLSGCSDKPTFSGDRMPESVKEISRSVYKLDVEADVHGDTLGVLWTGEVLLDEENKGISKPVNETIGNLSSVVSRVALSTDRPVEFVVVAVRGITEQMELRVVRRVDDIRRAQAEALPVPESMNRTLFLQAPFDPEKSADKPFDAGNWTLDDFLVKQTVQRVRMAKPADPKNPIPTELYDGKCVTDKKGLRTFEFSILTFKQENSRENILAVLRNVRDVLVAYRYDAFDQIIIRDLIHKRQLVIGKSTMKIFEARKITEEEILNTRLAPDNTRAGAFKNALEVFGFNIS